jgi:predicted DNA-binding transcriptional regulator YafY
MISKKKKKVVGRNLTRALEMRIAYIHEQIFNWRYPTQESLASDLEVSTDCIDDDIRTMRTYRKLPIEFSRVPGKFGYHYTGPVPEKLGGVTITEQQLLNIVFADSSMSEVPVKGGKKRMDLGLDGISEMLDPRSKALVKDLRGAVYFRPFAPEEIDLQLLVAIAEAIRYRKIIKVYYKKHMAADADLKELHPYCFTCAANAWYMIAFDPNSGESGEFKTYLLSRMNDAKVLEEQFKRRHFDIDEYLEGAFIIMKGTGKEWFDVVVEFDSWAAAYVRNRRYTKYQKFDELPDGGLRVSLKLTCLEEVEAWICYWRHHARVVSPLPLVERLYSYGQYLVKTCGEVLETLKRNGEGETPETEKGRNGETGSQGS